MRDLRLKLASHLRRTLPAFALAAMSLTPAAYAQETAPPAGKAPAYDVVSIKPNKSGSGMVRVSDGNDGYNATNLNLVEIIQYAYKLNTSEQISGLPGWADSAGWDIQAKIDPDELAALKKLPRAESSTQRRVMMQGLLADRFHLVVHHATKDLPMYALVPAKNGSKLEEADPNNTYSNGIKGPDGTAHPGMMMTGNGELKAQAVPISTLAMMLSKEVHRQVVDKSGLTGKYDITLRWTPDEMANDAAASGAPVGESAPSLFTALQEQLGLRLDSVKGPVDTIVVDHLEQPTEN
jgi:uncharacterized protein (TIGR03435 family)